jgi:hypothetical protein
VFTFGSGDTQQLGHCTAAEVAAATQLALTDAAASRHAIAQWSADCAVPRLVPAVPLGAVAIAVGATVSAAITSNGNVLMWGFGVDTPVPAQQPHVRDKPMALVALGGADWTLYVTRPPRDVHFLEFDAIAALDSDQSATIQVPPLAPAAAFRGLSIARASMSVASESFGGAVLADGRALMWGENGCHQLGTGDALNVPVTAPRELALFHTASASASSALSSSSAPKSLLLSHLACGAEHSVALTRAGVVCAFGAGMFGRLGVEPRSEADAQRPRVVRALLPASEHAAAAVAAADEADAIDAAYEASQPPHAQVRVGWRLCDSIDHGKYFSHPSILCHTQQSVSSRVSPIFVQFQEKCENSASTLICLPPVIDSSLIGLSRRRRRPRSWRPCWTRAIA